MFSSSADLRAGLHRCLATLRNAAAGPGEADAPWWSGIPEVLQAAAAARTLTLEQVAPIFTEAPGYALLVGGMARLGLTAPAAEVLARDFADAVLSGRALRAHAGRDVYGASNKRIWDRLVAPVDAAVGRLYGGGVDEEVDVFTRAPNPGVLERLGWLIGFDTQPTGDGHEACAAWLEGQLASLGFAVEVRRAAGYAPLLVAMRPARGLRGEVVMYGHYDVSPYELERPWRYPPQRLTAAEGRLWGRGVADNLGPLATRLWAVGSLDEAPALRWFIQGEEERGSPFAHAVLPELLAGLRPTVWLEETGYHDHADGTLRLLARTIGGRPGESAPPDAALADLLLGLRLLMVSRRLATREEWRSLNKDVVAGGCPYGHNLPTGARYIALGVNDSRARIHTTDESIPAWTPALHREELQVVFRWADRVADGP